MTATAMFAAGVALTRRRLLDRSYRRDKDGQFASGHSVSRAEAEAEALAQQRLLDRTYKRDKAGRFSSGGGGGVRESLAQAATISEINQTAMAEIRRVTGRSVEVDMKGSDPQVAREHLEGVLRGLERYPDAEVDTVGTFGEGGSHPLTRLERSLLADTHAITKFSSTGTEVLFNARGSANPEQYRRELAFGAATNGAKPDSPTGVAIHEMGHVVAGGAGGNVSIMARSAVQRMAAQAGYSGPDARKAFVTKQISRYAASDDEELIGEALTDVMMSGSKASPASREVVRLLDGDYTQHEGRMGVTNRFGRASVLAQVLLDRSYKRDREGKFSSGGAGGGVRDALANAGTIEEINKAATDEARRITGRTVQIDMAGSDPQIAREHLEGVLQGLERYPEVRVGLVCTYGGLASARPELHSDRADPDRAAVQRAYAVSPTLAELRGVIYVHTIGFNSRYAGDPAGYRASLAHHEENGWTIRGGPITTGLHEFGHILANHAGAEVVAGQIATTYARAQGVPRSAAIREGVSEYAATNRRELTAEAFTDVIMNGADAGALSQQIVAEIDRKMGR